MSSKKIWKEVSSLCLTNLHTPGIRGLVEGVLHDLTDGLALREDLCEVLGAQHIPQGRRGEQTRRVAGEEENKNVVHYGI